MLLSSNSNRELLRKMIVKIGLESIDTQKGITVEVLLDSDAIGLVISLEFARKLRKIKRPIYIRNIDRIFNNKELI